MNNLKSKIRIILLIEEVVHRSKYLGIYLDRNVNFNYHLNIIRERCLKKMNYLKVLKYKKWALDNKVKKQVYSAMVRSNIDYCGPLLHNISEHNKKMIEAIQYHSMLHIINWPWRSSHTKMREELGLEKLSDRYKRLTKEYIDSSILNNRLIRKLKEY